MCLCFPCRMKNLDDGIRFPGFLPKKNGCNRTGPVRFEPVFGPVRLIFHKINVIRFGWFFESKPNRTEPWTLLPRAFIAFTIRFGVTILSRHHGYPTNQYRWKTQLRPWPSSAICFYFFTARDHSIKLLPIFFYFILQKLH
jgi:hypothetical protein